MNSLRNRLAIILSAVALFVAIHYLVDRRLEPGRLELLGQRTDLPRALLHAAEYGSARAAGDQPRFAPGEQHFDVADMPARLAAFTLGGLRGFFVIYLWTEAEQQKNQRIHEDLLDKYYRIVDLEPDYPSVWDFHAWNMAWNISVQWSTTERRYEWVRHGIDFLREGIRRNPRSVTLLETMGRIYKEKCAQAFNPADRVYFSEHCQADDGAPPLLLAYQWYDRARKVMDETGQNDAVFSRLTVSQQPCFAMNEYAKQVTRQALDQLDAAAQAQLSGNTGEAEKLLASGRQTLQRARRLWNTTVIEWSKEHERFAEDNNALLFGNGAALAARIMADPQWDVSLQPAHLRDHPKDLAARVQSAQLLDLLVAPQQYQLPPVGARYGP
jgi:hypothetical protein